MIWQTQCCTIKDYVFLRWLRDRLIHVHNEDPDTDFMERLGQIADEIERHYHDPDIESTETDFDGESHAGKEVSYS